MRINVSFTVNEVSAINAFLARSREMTMAIVAMISRTFSIEQPEETGAETLPAPTEKTGENYHMTWDGNTFTLDTSEELTTTFIRVAGMFNDLYGRVIGGLIGPIGAIVSVFKTSSEEFKEISKEANEEFAKVLK